MRVVSYNVRYFAHLLKGLASTAEGKAQIGAALASLTPLADVIALQEVETRSIRALAASRAMRAGETQLEAFVRQLEGAMQVNGKLMPYRAYYFPAHTYFLGPVTFYTTGLAMLVNTQTVHVLGGNDTAPMEITARASEALRRLKQTRITAHLRLENVQGRPFHVFNTHMSLPTPWQRDFWKGDGRMGYGPNQLVEARAIRDYVAATAKDEPFVLLGDFNSAPGSPVYELFTRDAKYLGAQEALGHVDVSKPEGFATAGFMKWRMHLDHVFCSPGVELADMEETFEFGDPRSRFHGLSDHVPLITRFEPK